MNELASSEITTLLVRYGGGEKEAIEQLLPLVYKELHRLAQSYMRKESSGQTLQATALVHEAYFRLVDQSQVQWQNRAHFFGVAAQAMRRILIDHARARKAAKRGGSQAKVSYDDGIQMQCESPEANDAVDLMALDAALDKLAALDKRRAQVVTLRYFGGLSIDEIAETMETSPATVKRDWTLARTWLHRELSNADLA